MSLLKITLSSKKVLKFYLNFSIEFFFLYCALFFGFLILLLTPPMQGPDEDFHFLSSYMLGSGNFSESVPAAAIAMQEQFISLRFSPDKKVMFKDIKECMTLREDTVILSKKKTDRLSNKRHQYVFPALSIAIGRIFTNNLCLLSYISRVGCLLSYTAIIFGAIRIVPIGKWFFCLLGLMPMSLFLAATTSHDSLLISTSFFLIAYIVYMWNKRRDDSWALVFLFVLTFVVTLQKPPYSLAGMSAIILMNKNNWKRIILSLVVILIISSIGFWLHSHLVMQQLTLAVSTPVASPSSPSFDKMIIASIYTMFDYNQLLLYIGSFAGCLGWLDTLLPPVLLVIYYLLLLLSPVVELPENNKIYIWQRLCLLGGGVMFFILLHLSFASVYPDTIPIYGLQGRYFIPFFPMAMLGLIVNPKNFFISRIKTWSALIFSSYIIFILVVTVVTIWQRYYGNYWWERGI